jgi:hypothetical protein
VTRVFGVGLVRAASARAGRRRTRVEPTGRRTADRGLTGRRLRVRRKLRPAVMGERLMNTGPDRRRGSSPIGPLGRLTGFSKGDRRAPVETGPTMTDRVGVGPVAPPPNARRLVHAVKVVVLSTVAGPLRIARPTIVRRPTARLSVEPRPTARRPMGRRTDGLRRGALPTIVLPGGRQARGRIRSARRPRRGATAVGQNGPGRLTTDRPATARSGTTGRAAMVVLDAAMGSEVRGHHRPAAQTDRTEIEQGAARTGPSTVRV